MQRKNQHKIEINQNILEWRMQKEMVLLRLLHLKAIPFQ